MESWGDVGQGFRGAEMPSCDWKVTSRRTKTNHSLNFSAGSLSLVLLLFFHSLVPGKHATVKLKRTI